MYNVTYFAQQYIPTWEVLWRCAFYSFKVNIYNCHKNKITTNEPKIWQNSQNYLVYVCFIGYLPDSPNLCVIYKCSQRQWQLTETNNSFWFSINSKKYMAFCKVAFFISLGGVKSWSPLSLARAMNSNTCIDTASLGSSSPFLVFGGARPSVNALLTYTYKIR